MFDNYHFKFSIILFFTFFSASISANQIDGCYKLAAGSKLQLWNTAQGGGNLLDSRDLIGAFVARTDNTYSLVAEESAASTTYIKALRFTSIREDRKNKQIVATGKVSFMLEPSPTNPPSEFEWRWDIVKSPSSTPGIIDTFTLQPVDSDVVPDGVDGSKLKIPLDYNLSFKLELESIETDDNKVKGCHRFTSDSLISMFEPAGSAGSSQAPLAGTFMSLGDNSYRIIPDPEVGGINKYFRNLVGNDVVGNDTIKVTGHFSYWNYKEEPIEWTWSINGIPDWSTDNTTFNLASSDSDDDTVPGVAMGGPHFFSTYNIALDINLEPVEVRPNENGAYQVGASDYDEGNNATGVPIIGTLRYPTLPNGDIGGSGPLPIVVFVHGNHSEEYGCSGSKIAVESYRGYDYILDSLAEHGFIALSIHLKFGSKFSDRADLLLEHLAIIKDWNNNGTGPLGGVLQGKLDMNNIGLVGHSKGAGAVEKTEYNNRISNLGYGINAVVSISPGSQGDIALGFIPQTPWLLFSGSAEGDGTNIIERFSVVDSSHDYPVIGLWFYGGRHHFYNTRWTSHYLSDFAGYEGPFLFEDKTLGGYQDHWLLPEDSFLASLIKPGENYSEFICSPTDQFPVFYQMQPIPFNEEIESARQQQITDTAITAFMRQYLKNDGNFDRVYSGELPLHGSHIVEKYWAYANPSRTVIDDFDGDDTVDISSQGGAVNISAGFSPLLQTTNYYNPEVGTLEKGWNINGVLIIGWSSPKTINWELVPNSRNVSSFNYVGFSAAQMHDNGVLNLFNQEKDIDIILEDETGNSSSVSLYDADQGVPYPSEIKSGLIDEIVLDAFKKSTLTSVRIPLSKFTGIDLTRIKSLTLQLNGSGFMALDHIQFTD